MKGVEDTPWWRKNSPQNGSNVVEVCVSCQKTIELWHCADGGCPWCAKCSAKLKKIDRQNGKA